MVEIHRIATSELTARKFDKYKDTQLIETLDKLSWNSPLILKGPKGTGKTLALEQWAYRNKVPLFRKSCTAELGDRQLVGSFTLASFDRSYFSLGVFPAAIDVANETGRCLLVLEEINALNEEVQKVVNGIADYRREVELPQIGRVYRLNPAFRLQEDATCLSFEPLNDYQYELALHYQSSDVVRTVLIPQYSLLKENMPMIDRLIPAGTVLSKPAQLWVCGTMNPGYGGTYDLNEDFRSRFKFLEVPHMQDEAEAAILRDALLSENMKKLSAQDERLIIQLQALSKETRGGTLGYALSLRDLLQVIEDYRIFGSIQPALVVLRSKFNDEMAQTLNARVRSVFNVDITNVTLT